ncbi:MAG: hypothetical protein JW825_02030 [Candidatus Methanofastidiosa archaeon]|nr:hypothetical protein [Candidatus Methanofastidiosa archaeon]
MALNMDSEEVDRGAVLGLLEDTLGPLELLRANTDLLILPQDMGTGLALNAYAIELCTKLISKGILAKMVIRDNFGALVKVTGRLALPPLLILNLAKEGAIMATIGDWILHKATEDAEVSFTFLIGGKEGAPFVKNTISGTLAEIEKLVLKR